VAFERRQGFSACGIGIAPWGGLIMGQAFWMSILTKKKLELV
jgi:hypothetical protein